MSCPLLIILLPNLQTTNQQVINFHMRVNEYKHVHHHVMGEFAVTPNRVSHYHVQPNVNLCRDRDMRV